MKFLSHWLRYAADSGHYHICFPALFTLWLFYSRQKFLLPPFCSLAGSWRCHIIISADFRNFLFCECLIFDIAAIFRTHEIINFVSMRCRTCNGPRLHWNGCVICWPGVVVSYFLNTTKEPFLSSFPTSTVSAESDQTMRLCSSYRRFTVSIFVTGITHLADYFIATGFVLASGRMDFSLSFVTIAQCFDCWSPAVTVCL